MKRFYKIALALFFLEFGVFTIGTIGSESNMLSTSQMLHADPPDEDIEPPDDPILNSPIPSDTVIYTSDGRPIIIIVN